MELISPIFIDINEQDEFIAVLREAVVDTGLSIDMIQRCLPLMGELVNKGGYPDDLLAAMIRENK